MTAAETSEISKRVNNRSRRPESEAFKTFISQQWGPRPANPYPRTEAAPYALARRVALGAQFQGIRLVIPAGSLVTRNNDCDYRFRPHSAFSHLTGLGTDRQPDAVLVLEPATAGQTNAETTPEGAGGTHSATLYFRPRASRGSQEFYADSTYGELWVGARPSLEEFTQHSAIECRHLDELAPALARDLPNTALGAIPTSDQNVAQLLERLRREAGVSPETAQELDEKLIEATSELRLIKDEWEVEQMRLAIAATQDSFEEAIRAFPRAARHHRGERVIEGAFGARAREMGNGLGYDTIAACGPHAATLHWINNDGVVRDGDVILLDAGVEVDSLYTADITRTLPINGKFTEVQRRIYQAVLDAADAAFEQANQPGCIFREVHDAAMRVIAARLEEWGLLPVSAAESLSPEGQQHRRWMVHGTSHHLGLDVHDCAQARAEMYNGAKLRPGMCFTIEPGLYFREDDLSVPPEYRGISVRIEDDILVREDGSCERLSQGIPRTVQEVETWIARLHA